MKKVTGLISALALSVGLVGSSFAGMNEVSHTADSTAYSTAGLNAAPDRDDVAVLPLMVAAFAAGALAAEVAHHHGGKRSAVETAAADELFD